MIIQPEFTNHCNFRCMFCPHSVYKKEGFNREKGYMSDELFDLCLENINKYATTCQIGFFGEMLLHPKFEEYIGRFPSSRRYQLFLNTNWSLVTEKNMDVLKQVDCVILSMDASNSELYDKLCPGSPVLGLDGRPRSDRYDALIEKLDYWLQLPDHAPTRIMYVASSVNEHDCIVFVEKWQSKLGFRDNITTKTVASYGGVMKDSYMSESSCNIAEIQNKFTIAWNGDCTPCNLDVNIALNVGNLLETRDIRKIMESERWKQVISLMRQKKSICANCFDGNNRSKDKSYQSFRLNQPF